MKTLAIIPARGGSKSIVRKNIRMLLGKPLIVWTILASISSRLVDRVVVSTDDNEIARIALAAGAEVPFMRPANIAGDNTPTIDVVFHCLEWLEHNQSYVPDCIALLQCTSPLRTTDDIDCAIKQFTENANAKALVSVTLASQSPYWMHTIDEKKYLHPFLGCEWRSFPNRQSLPAVYRENGAIFLTDRNLLIEKNTLTPEPIMAYVMSEDRSIDIDTEIDFLVAEWVMNKGGVL